MAGVTVYLDLNGNRTSDAGEPSTLTAADGSYAFTGVQPGTYTVREVVPADFQQTKPGTTPNRLFAVNTQRQPQPDRRGGPVHRAGHPGLRRAAGCRSPPRTPAWPSRTGCCTSSPTATTCCTGSIPRPAR